MTAAHELTASYDCRAPNCTRQAKTNRGPYAYLCEEHIREKARRVAAGEDGSAGVGLRVAPAPRTETRTAKTKTFAAHARRLSSLAKAADRAQATYERALQRAREAKASADTARHAFQQAVRDATGEGE